MTSPHAEKVEELFLWAFARRPNEAQMNLALANIERSSFLTGTNDRGWRADLEFLLQPSSFAKVHDGGYGNGRHTAPKPITIPQRRGPAPGSSEYLEQIAREVGLS